MLAFASLIVLMASMSAYTQSDPGQSPTIWDGVFSAEQVARGKDRFNIYCSQCHMEDLSGGDGTRVAQPGPPLVGARFMTTWDGATVNELFEKISKTMPRNARGTLSSKDAIDIVSFVLQSNGFPAGKADLVPDPPALRSVQMVGKNGPMPAVPGQLVKTMGCLTQAANGGWLLTTATVPMRTRNTGASSASDLLAMKSMPLGSETLKLTAADPGTDAYGGHRMEVTGLFGGDAIVIVAIASVADSCAP